MFKTLKYNNNKLNHKSNNNKQLNNKSNDYIDNILKYNNIQKITNIYQEKYLNGNSTGLGDFIRGSIFLLQYCRLYNIECNISLKNHKLFKFLNNYDNNIYNNDLTIIKNTELNCKLFDVKNEIKYITYNTFESIHLFNSYLFNIKDTYNNNNLNINTHFFPLYENILPEHKEHIKKLFEPKDTIKNIAYNALKEMNLTIGNYKLIHIRCGDKELIDNIINTNAHDKILNIVKDYDKDILVISDSNKLKEKIKLKYPVINIFKNKIKHIGEGVANNDDTYISLLVDLLFISLSKEVLGLSTLHHGSGFSEWVSRINNIPYKCLFIE